MTAEEKTKLKKALPVFFLVMALWWGVNFTVRAKIRFADWAQKHVNEYVCNQIEYSMGWKEDSWANYFTYSMGPNCRDTTTTKGMDCWLELMKIYIQTCSPSGQEKLKKMWCPGEGEI